MMDHEHLLAYAVAIVGVLFTILMCLLGWLGTRIYTKLDELGKALVAQAGDLHERINGVDRRVIAIEVECDMRHRESS